MKGKIFAAVLCAAMACTMFAACDDKSNDGGNTSETPAVVLTKDTDFDALVSDKVTKDEWDAAFTNESFAGVTSNMVTDGLELTTNFGYKKTADGFDIRFVIGMGEEANEMIAHVVGTQATQYIKQDDTYYYDTMDLSGDEHKVEREWSASFRLYIAYDFAGQYDSFTYDETQHAYIYEEDEMRIPYSPMEAMGNGYTISYATLKFAGGKLAYAKVKTRSGDEEVFKYYDYGATEVVIPTDAQSADEIGGLF